MIFSKWKRRKRTQESLLDFIHLQLTGVHLSVSGTEKGFHLDAIDRHLARLNLRFAMMDLGGRSVGP